MKNRIKKRRFYFGYQQRSREAKWLEEQVRYVDPLQLGNEVWGKVAPIGREFGAAEIKKERRTD